MLRATVSACAIALALVAAASSAGASGPAAGVHQYCVHHDTIGEIGHHSYTFERNGGELVISSKVRIEAKVLFFTARRYAADRREVWRDGRLVAFTSHTDDDGTILDVTARADGDRLIIEGPKGHAEAPADIVPNSAWNADIVSRSNRTLFDVETGEILEVKVSDDGFDQIEAAGHWVKAHKFTLSGGMDRTLWFAEDGTWLQLKMRRGDDLITVVMN